MLLDEAPEAPCIGVHRTALVDDQRARVGQRTIGDIAVAGDPADIGSTPEHIMQLEIEHPLRGQLGTEQITGAGMLDALRLACGAGGIEQKQRMLCLNPFGLAHRRLGGQHFMPPLVPTGGHRYIVTSLAQHNYLLDAGRTFR